MHIAQHKLLINFISSTVYSQSIAYHWETQLDSLTVQNKLLDIITLEQQLEDDDV